MSNQNEVIVTPAPLEIRLNGRSRERCQQKLRDDELDILQYQHEILRVMSVPVLFNADCDR